MSAEIKISATLAATKGSFVLPKFGGSYTADMAVAGGGVPGIVVATNAANGVNIASTGLTTPGWCLLLNLDDTAYIDWGVVDTGVLKVVGRMLPGEPALLRLVPGATFAVKSSIASSKVQVILLDT